MEDPMWDTATVQDLIDFVDRKLDEMNKEDYVSFEVAKLLKEKGFNEPCFSQYTKTGSIWNCQAPENFNESEGCYSRPSLYEAQKWLRHQHNLYVNAIPLEIPRSKSENFTFTIDKLDSNDEWDWRWEPEPYNFYATYEEAFSEGILEALRQVSNE